jgi:hypothetical protein
MNRRGFLRSIGLGIGGIALEQAIPLGRVWSFPKKIAIADPLCPPNALYLACAGRGVLLPNDKVQLYGGARGGWKTAVIKSIDRRRCIITLDYPA